jgi:hypothetical protein
MRDDHHADRRRVRRHQGAPERPTRPAASRPAPHRPSRRHTSPSPADRPPGPTSAWARGVHPRPRARRPPRRTGCPGRRGARRRDGAPPPRPTPPPSRPPGEHRDVRRPGRCRVRRPWRPRWRGRRPTRTRDRHPAGHCRSDRRPPPPARPGRRPPPRRGHRARCQPRPRPAGSVGRLDRASPTGHHRPVTGTRPARSSLARGAAARTPRSSGSKDAWRSSWHSARS